MSIVQAIRTANETVHAKTASRQDRKMSCLVNSPLMPAKFFIGGKELAINEGMSGSVDIIVSPPGPFRCLLADPDSTRRTEMYYEGRRFTSVHVIPFNGYRPAHLVFNVNPYQFDDMEKIAAKIAERM